MSLLSNYRLSGNTHDTTEFGSISIGSGSFIQDEKGLVADIKNTVASIPLNRIPLTLTNETITFWLKSEFPRTSSVGGSFSNRFIHWGSYFGGNSGGLGLQSGQVRCYLRGPNASGWTDYPSIPSMHPVYDKGGWIHYAIVFTPGNRFKVYANGVKYLDILLSRPYTGMTEEGVVFGLNTLSRLSDVRVYTEVLNDESIYEVFAQRGSLGSDGSFYTPRLLESLSDAFGPTSYGFSVKSVSEVGPNANLMHWYPLIGDAYDRLRHSNDAPTNVTYDDNGAVFNGTSQVKGDKIFLPATGFTVAMWVVSVDTGTFSTLIDQGGVDSLYSGFAAAADWRSGDRYQALLWRVPTSGFTVDFPDFFKNRSGIATHVMLTYQSGILIAYRDGEFFGSKLHDAPGTGGDHLMIGSRVTEDFRLTGNIRDLKIYDDVLTPLQARVLYNLTLVNGQGMIMTPACLYVKSRLKEV